MSEERVERRLAAILAADIVGYSRLMGRDEVGTLSRIRSHRREFIDPKIAEHKGRIVKTTGDGLLIEFTSVIDAVRCAAEWQSGMTERTAADSDGAKIEFRSLLPGWRSPMFGASTWTSPATAAWTLSRWATQTTG